MYSSYEFICNRRQCYVPRTTVRKKDTKQKEMEFGKFSSDGPRFFMFDRGLVQKNSGKSFSYNPIEDSFSPISLPPRSCIDSSVFITGNEVFFFNGKTTGIPRFEFVSSVNSYSIATNRYRMNVFRCYSINRVDSVILPNHMNQCQAYQVGGFDYQKNPFKYVAFCDFNVMKYYICSGMHFDDYFRISKGTSTMGANFLFTQDLQGTYVIWDPRVSFVESRKKYLDFLLNRYHDYSIAPSDNSIYLTGGTKEYGKYSDDFYQFDIRMLNGFYKSKMPNSRRLHGSFVFGKELYVLGGMTGDVRNNKNIDIIDVTGEDWRINSTKLPCYINCKKSVFKNDYFR